MARRYGKIKRDRTDSAVKVEHGLSALQCRELVNPVVELARRERIGLRKNAGGKDKLQIADTLHDRVAAAKRSKAIAPNDVAAIFVNILDHTGDEWKPLLETFRQRRALGKGGMSGNQSQA